MKRSLFKYIPIAAVLFGSLFAFSLANADSPLSEREIQTAFLFNFAKFVEWPADAFKNSKDSLVIGILGKDPFDEKSEEIWMGKTIQDKKLIFKRLSRSSEAAGCQMVFISASERGHVGAILDSLHETPVLTVSDMSDFVHQGGMIGFVLENKRVGFNINQTAAQKAGLKISSQLLKLAKVIVKTLLGRLSGLA